jgi:hypothetical protein
MTTTRPGQARPGRPGPRPSRPGQRRPIREARWYPPDDPHDETP